MTSVTEGEKYMATKEAKKKVSKTSEVTKTPKAVKAKKAAEKTTEAYLKALNG